MRVARSKVPEVESGLVAAGMRGVGLAWRQRRLGNWLGPGSQRPQNSHYTCVCGEDSQTEGAEDGGEEDQNANQAAQIRARLMDRYRTTPPFPASRAGFSRCSAFSLYPH